MEVILMSVGEFVDFCRRQHDVECNQKYNVELPYSFHLDRVIGEAVEFRSLIETKDFNTVVMSCAGHDLIEDARMTYNDIANIAGKEVVDIIYCCTEEKGRNRDERHSERYYTELAKNKLAVFVKLCDIIANVKFGILTNSSMVDKYKREHSKTVEYLYFKEYRPMFDYLEKLFTLKT